MVAEHEEKVVGYMLYELNKGSMEFLNFAVSPHYQRRGVGRQMLDKLIGKLSHQRRNRIIANVSEDNDDAHLFFKAMGFRAEGISREHFDNGRDAYLFVYRYGDHREET